MRTQKFFLCARLFSKPPISLRKHAVETFFSFDKRNGCMKLPTETRVKLTQEKSLFYIPCSFLEFKMNSNSVKFDSARMWHKRLLNLYQADVLRNALKDSGRIRCDVCNVCTSAKITKTPVRRVAETQVKDRLERVFTDVMSFQSRFTIRVPV